ncbi:nucleotide-binding protein [Myxococcota bacterium]|nr:nucleotide-binding protein [Myxococcota bacterium]
MRKVTTVAFAAMMLAGCQDQKPAATTAAPAVNTVAAPAQAASQPANTAMTPPAGGTIRGKVVEKIDAAGYSYFRLETAGGELWAAVPAAPTAVGAEVEIVDSMLMQNFESKTLGRKWDKIMFGQLGSATGGAAAQPQGAASQPSALPQGMQMPAGHPPAEPVKVGDVKVDKATGANAKTVAEVWSERAKLKDQKVTVRGKVVKSSNGIMGKNWLHLRDGSGTDAAKDNDLTVTTAATADVGETVTIEGTLRTDKDFGAGYSYGAIVEDAVVK